MISFYDLFLFYELFHFMVSLKVTIIVIIRFECLKVVFAKINHILFNGVCHHSTSQHELCFEGDLEEI